MSQIYDVDMKPFPDLHVIKRYKSIDYGDYDYEIEVVKLEDGYVYGIATNYDTGHVLWTRGRKKETIVARLKKEIRDEWKEYDVQGGWGRF